MKRILLLLSFTAFLCATVGAQNFDNVQMKCTKIKDSIYLMQGAGGNIGLLIGPDGVFMIDDQYRELGEKIEKAVAKITDRPSITFSTPIGILITQGAMKLLEKKPRSLPMKMCVSVYKKIIPLRHLDGMLKQWKLQAGLL